MAVVARKQENIAAAICLSSDGVGALVYVRGAEVGGKYLVETADPSDYDKMPAVGMIVHKPANDATDCFIQFRGEVRDVYAGLIPGERLFLDDSGGLASEPPEPTVGTPAKFMQDVGVALSAGAIELNPNYMIAKRRI